MVSFMVLEVRLFGALKRFGERGIIFVEAPPGSTVAAVRQAIQQHLEGQFVDSFPAGVFERSALANDTRVFAEMDEVVTGSCLSLLPPVCGG